MEENEKCMGPGVLCEQLAVLKVLSIVTVDND